MDEGLISISIVGCAVTLISLSLILSLTIYEFIDYRKVHMVRRTTQPSPLWISDRHVPLRRGPHAACEAGPDRA